MTHSTITLEVSGLPVTAAVIHNRLELPMRSLIAGTLGMHFAAQAKKLKRLAARFQVRQRDVAIGQRAGTEPCLPAHRLTAFLWTLTPRRPDVRDKLARLQDGWDSALLAWHGVKTDDIGGPGAWLARVVADASRAAKREADELRAENGRLQQALAEAQASQKIYKVLPTPVSCRWDGKAKGDGVFLEIAKMNADGLNNAEIAKRTGCSRTTVSLFLDGKYRSGAAKSAWDTLHASGWKKRLRE